MRGCGARNATSARTAARLALAALALMAAVLFEGPAIADPPGNQPTSTPRQVLNMLYLDLAGLAGPATRTPPLWRSYLSDRTGALQQELDARDTEDRWDALRTDWLCQCVNRGHVKIPPLILAEERTRAGVTLTVKLALHAGETETLTISFVDQDGWKIDDIVDEHGRRFSGALANAIRDHERRRRPLP